MARVIGTAVSGVLLLCGFGFGLLGCGGSESDALSVAQLEKAKEEGEQVGRERARVDELEEEVRSLKRNAQEPGAKPAPDVVSSTPASPEGGSGELLRSFHAPSGNVSCAITSAGAFCTVDSIATTFRVEAGSPGQVESGSALSRGFGELAAYGSTVSAGSITCTIPSSSEPRGIVCTDIESGHGFEASRVAARQDAY